MNAQRRISELLSRNTKFFQHTQGDLFFLSSKIDLREKEIHKKATPNIFFFPRTDHKFFNGGIFQRKPVFCTEVKRKVSNSPVVPCPLPHPSVTRLVSGTSLGNQTSCNSVILHLQQHQQPVMLHLQNHPVLTERSPYIYWVSMKCDLKRTRTKIPA